MTYLKSQIFFQYADDTMMLCKGPSIDSLQHTLDREVQALREWFQANGLVMNEDKTQLIKFSTNNRYNTDKITISNSKISLQQNVNFLGIIVNENLNWEPHVGSLIKRLNSCIFSLRLIRQADNLKT
jgi:hypothetical protein